MLLLAILKLALGYITVESGSSTPAPIQYISAVDGMQLAYRDFNNNHQINQTTIIMCHGAFSSGEIFYKQFQDPVLQPYRIIAWDQRGFGYSQKPLAESNYTNHTLIAEDLNAVIKGLKLVRPVISGWSVGAMFVADYLTRYGDSQVSGVSFIDSIACVSDSCIKSSGESLSVFKLLASSNQTLNLLGTEQYAKSMAYNRSVTTPNALMVSSIALQTPVPVIANRFRLQFFNYNETIANLTIPILFQYGSNDNLYIDPGTPMQYHNIQQRTKLASYDEGGHIPFILQPQAFNLDLAAWLSQF